MEKVVDYINKISIKTNYKLKLNFIELKPISRNSIMQTMMHSKQEFIEGEKPYKMIKKEEEEPEVIIKSEDKPEPISSTPLTVKPPVMMPVFMPMMTPMNPYMYQAQAQAMAMSYYSNMMMRMPMMQQRMYGMNPAMKQQQFQQQQQQQPQTLNKKRSNLKPFTILRGCKGQIKSHRSPYSASTSAALSAKSDSPIEVSFIPANINITKKEKKKCLRVSACKNYIGLLCAGFARAMLTSERSSAIIKQASELVEQKRSRLQTQEGQSTQDLVEFLKTYIHKNICGKRVKKSNRERDFKVRNTEELDLLLMPKEGDSIHTSATKELLRDMFDYFFDSECYDDWLSKGMISESNRIFFVKNKAEIHRKFQNPMFHKPRFDHAREEAKN